MLKLIYDLYQSWRMNRAMSEASTGESCVACDGTDVTLLGPAAYRCNACGYEGGDGLAALHRAEREAAFARMPEAARRASARGDLEEARRLLTSGLGDLDRAQRVGAMDTLGVGGTGYAGSGGEGAEKYSELNGAMGLLMEAEGLVRDAVAKLYGESSSGESRFDAPSYVAASLDVHFDNLLSDLAFHSRVSSAQGEARQLLATVERLLEEA